MAVPPPPPPSLRGAKKWGLGGEEEKEEDPFGATSTYAQSIAKKGGDGGMKVAKKWLSRKYIRLKNGRMLCRQRSAVHTYATVGT